jgi:hypothetical protein
VNTQTAPQPARMKADSGAVDDAARDTARQIERDNPRWIVVFGTYTKEFVCFPRFCAMPGTIVTAFYPAAASARMTEIERALGIKEDKIGEGTETAGKGPARWTI